MNPSLDKIIRFGRGEETADLLLKNGKVVNVFTGWWSSSIKYVRRKASIQENFEWVVVAFVFHRSGCR